MCVFFVVCVCQAFETVDGFDDMFRGLSEKTFPCLADLRKAVQDAPKGAAKDGKTILIESFMITAIEKISSGNKENAFVESLQNNLQYVDSDNTFAITRDDLHPAVVKKGHEIATSE